MKYFVISCCQVSRCCGKLGGWNPTKERKLREKWRRNLPGQDAPQLFASLYVLNNSGEVPHQVWTLLSLQSRRVSTPRRRRISRLTLWKPTSVHQTGNISIFGRNLGSVRSAWRYSESSPTPSPWLSSLSGATGKNVCGGGLYPGLELTEDSLYSLLCLSSDVMY